MPRLNPRQVEAFRALMLTSSTVRAAQSLAITQPAVSRLVRDLQEVLGLTLFERRGTRLLPTSEAIALYAEVERSFVGLERIAQAARDLQDRRAGVLRIAAMPALCNGVLPRFAGTFLAKHERVDFALAGLISSAVLDRVVTEQCDVGFAAAPIEHAAVAHRKLPAVSYVAVVPEGHRLARRRTLRPRDFAGEPFIALGPTTPSAAPSSPCWNSRSPRSSLRIARPRRWRASSSRASPPTSSAGRGRGRCGSAVPRGARTTRS